MGQASVPPPAAIDRAPSEPAAVAPPEYPPTRLSQLGVGLVALAAVVMLVAGGGVVIEQLDGARQLTSPISVLIPLWVLALLALTAFVSTLWMRVVGLVAAAGFAMLLVTSLYWWKTHESVLPGEPVSLAPAGWALVLSSLVAAAGVVLVVGWFTPAAEVVEGERRAPKGVWSALLGVAAAFLLGVTGPPAIVLGRLHFREQPDGSAGSGAARWGIVLGTIAAIAWFFGMFVNGWVTEPGATSGAAAETTVATADPTSFTTWDASEHGFTVMIPEEWEVLGLLDEDAKRQIAGPDNPVAPELLTMPMLAARGEDEDGLFVTELPWEVDENGYDPYRQLQLMDEGSMLALEEEVSQPGIEMNADLIELPGGHRALLTDWRADEYGMRSGTLIVATEDRVAYSVTWTDSPPFVAGLTDTISASFTLVDR